MASLNKTVRVEGILACVSEIQVGKNRLLPFAVLMLWLQARDDGRVNCSIIADMLGGIQHLLGSEVTLGWAHWSVCENPDAQSFWKEHCGLVTNMLIFSREDEELLSLIIEEIKDEGERHGDGKGRAPIRYAHAAVLRAAAKKTGVLA